LSIERNSRTIVATTALVLWFLSWLALYLEMFRWRHVVLGHLVDVVWPDPFAGDTPGGFVRSVVVSSAVVPPIALALLIANGRTWTRALANATVVSGSTLALLGAANQFAHPQALILDPTLQQGNGGIVLLGALLIGIGLLEQRTFRTRRTPADRPGA
jgi:hypothetical protein